MAAVKKCVGVRWARVYGMTERCFHVEPVHLVSKEPPAEAALRAVHTAAGRLDMMWRDEEDLWSASFLVSL